MKETFATKIIRFNKELNFSQDLYKGIQVMNPFQDNPEILEITEAFYGKFYNDTHKRKLIVGINPGRLGAGITGIPFTDSKRLKEVCDIDIASVNSHEPSSVFVYEVIEAYGGVERFYGEFFINSMFPLGFIQQNAKGNWVNCNYYDYPALFEQTKPFIVENLKKLLAMGVDTSNCIVLGKKNAKYLKAINTQEKIFDTVTVLDHPRYIVQYKSKEKERYLTEYLLALQ
ncbi:SMUG2 DNA glycosylase family protein [Arenibacter lacus]|uniref:SMUG2 DNA glycosylase family protein n=1 Tax=Arenibacter lacus TaxID=2608629 RepID=UPI00123E0059|nr:SMUG2 DNA glycosylase family protein [Arenibacter lacus]